MGKIKQILCRHRYADKNLDIVEINHYTDTVRMKNYCVKCGKPYEVSFSYTCMFGEVDAEIKRQLIEKGGDSMDVQKWLDQFAMIDELIAANEAEQQRIFEQATNTVSSADGLPHANGKTDKVGNYAVKLAELTKRKNALLNRKERMIKTLEKLPANEYGVLHREYVRYMTQEQIAADMAYSTVQIWRIKCKAKERLSEIIAKKKGQP